MREAAIRYLFDPETGAPLSLESPAGPGEDIQEGALINPECAGKRFPIRAGVPRFVDSGAMDKDQQETVEAFSYKWSRIPAYAAERATKSNREKWYFQRFDFPDGDDDVRAFLGQANVILEAGTGTGVDTDILVRNSDATVIGVDISAAIDQAYKRFRGNPRVVLAQADIGSLPFRPALFDIVSCDQVLHHTPDPRGNFTKLVRLLKSGGRLLLYVYRMKGPVREFCDDLLRGRMTRAPLDECLDFCERVTRLGRSLSRLGTMVEVEDDIPELGIVRGRQDVQRLIYNSVFKCFWNEEYDELTNVMINFDWYRPLHAFRFTEEDIHRWAREERLDVTRFHVEPSGISAIMVRT